MIIDEFCAILLIVFWASTVQVVPCNGSLNKRSQQCGFLAVIWTTLNLTSNQISVIYLSAVPLVVTSSMSLTMRVCVYVLALYQRCEVAISWLTGISHTHLIFQSELMALPIILLGEVILISHFPFPQSSYLQDPTYFLEVFQTPVT